MITFSFQIKYNLIDRKIIKNWLNSVANQEGKEVGELNYLFVDDHEILKYNKKYLKHDYYTDIITFDASENQKICGDIIISIERVEENAKKFNVKTNDELNRVMVHGLLHLIGYDDKKQKDAKEIIEKENNYLKKLNN